MWHRQGRLRKYGLRVVSSKDDNFYGYFSNILSNIKSLYASKDYIIFIWMED